MGLKYIAKILLLGDGGVGKTALRHRAIKGGFNPAYLMTLGADFSTTTIQLNDVSLVYSIWDIAGQTMFQDIRKQFYDRTYAAIIVFDLTNKITFDNVKNWMEEYELNNTIDIEKTPIILVGNKSDLIDGRVIKYEQGENLAKEIEKQFSNVSSVQYMETSALDDINIELMLQELGRKIVDIFSKL